MRAIKFRVWDSTKKKMHYDLWQLQWAKDGLWAMPSKYEMLNTTVKPLMQFTGLQDKNGRDIYEGDILSDIGKVYWDSEKAFYTTDSGGLYYILRRVSSEVIGNICENPESLKETNHV